MVRALCVLALREMHQKLTKLDQHEMLLGHTGLNDIIDHSMY